MEISEIGEFGLIHRLTDDIKPKNSSATATVQTLPQTADAVICSKITLTSH